jgi:hypothetical protein
MAAERLVPIAEYVVQLISQSAMKQIGMGLKGDYFENDIIPE